MVCMFDQGETLQREITWLLGLKKASFILFSSQLFFDFFVPIVSLFYNLMFGALTVIIIQISYTVRITIF